MWLDSKPDRTGPTPALPLVSWVALGKLTQFFSLYQELLNPQLAQLFLSNGINGTRVMAVSYGVYETFHVGFKAKFTSPERYFLESFKIRCPVYVATRDISWEFAGQNKPHLATNQKNIKNLTEQSVPLQQADLISHQDSPNPLKEGPTSLQYLFFPHTHQS